jgi:predicted O-methyltransferase YrrM
LVLARALQLHGGGRLISFDQHADFVASTRDWLAEYGLRADLRAVPLRPVEGWPGLWYDQGALPDRIDLMLVDGPPWALHPLTRGAAVTLFDRIAPGGTIMLDDGARPGERLVARRWRQLRPDFDFTLMKAGTKGTLIGRKAG